MTKRIISAGLLGVVVLFAWTFLINGLLRFEARINMKNLADEPLVYEMLNEQVTAPGRYVCNPQLTEAGFPLGKPVYSILYGGVGHEAAGGLVISHLLLGLLASLLAAWLLSQASRRVLMSYLRKVGFYVSLGLFLAILGNLYDYGIGGYPLTDALMLAAGQVVGWLVVGLAVAPIIRPDPPAAEGS